ncbi:MAG TPA: membrane dipeptidase [Thermoanaerobaculia bacterium]|nr:membrane dipeptidase [Thermoanaerobaculia bacterium]
MLNRGRFRLFAADSPDSTEYSARAIELVGRSTVIDMLSLLTLDWPKLYGWQDAPATFGEAEFHKLKSSGVTVFHPAVDPQSARPREAALRWTARWNNLLGAHPGWLQRIDGAADLKRVHQEMKIGILVGFQNSDHFQSVRDVALFHGLGQRVSQLTYNACNRLGAGCEEQRDTGLTEYGAQIVQEMNRHGMAVDISHCSDRTSLDSIAVSRKPVLVTHSNCRALVAHRRCKSDAVIKQLAAHGGVMGITVIPAFVRQGQPARFEDVLAHFDHVARLVGVEHVGLGSDTDLDAIDPRTHRTRPRYVIQGLQHTRRTFDIAEGLLRRGYGAQQIELILGGNFQRALTEIWNVQPAAPVPA